MLFTLKNNKITVTLSTLGAEIKSVKNNADGCEYVWQGNPDYWTGQTPIMFPICGRLIDGKYTFGGKTYEMVLHGFARHCEFVGEQIGESAVRFTLDANEETKKIYPFDFSFVVDYRLEGNTLATDLTVRNTGKEILPATVGLHPGFNVPLDTGSFDDWYLEFGEVCYPDTFLVSPTCFLTGLKEAFPLVEGKRLNLKHNLFDNDAIFLSRAARSVTLRSDKSERSLTFRYPDFPYVGFWHSRGTDAPFVCIEPWCGMPAVDGMIEDFAKKNDMFRLLPGSEKKVCAAIDFN